MDVFNITGPMACQLTLVDEGHTLLNFLEFCKLGVMLVALNKPGKK